MEVYLDNASTTKVRDEVIKSMQIYQTDNYSNPSSIHFQGEKARQALEKARKIIADKINAKPNEIIFTSGATESNNLALRGIANYHKKGHIITTKIEHASVLETCKDLEKQGFKISYLDVDHKGYIGLKDLENNITKETILISVIHANNEIGTIQDRTASTGRPAAPRAFLTTPFNSSKTPTAPSLARCSSSSSTSTS
jgi:cysteine desulfurase